MFSDPIQVALCFGALLGGVALVTSPLWVRLGIKLWKAGNHQLNDAGRAIDSAIQPKDKPEKK